MNKKTAVLGIAIFFVIALLLAIGLIYQETSRKPSEKKVVSGERRKTSREQTPPKAAFTWIAVDFPTLVKNSDTIVRGTVVQTLPGTKVEIPKIMIGEKAAEEARARGETDFVTVPSEKDAKGIANNLNTFAYTGKIIKVNKYYKNPLQQKNIIVLTMNVASDELSLEDGDEVILFLEKFLSMRYENVSQQKYQIMGGPQGKYVIKQDQAINFDAQKSKKMSDLEAEVMSLVSQQ